MITNNGAAWVNLADSLTDDLPQNEPAGLSYEGNSEIKRLSVLVGDIDKSYKIRTLRGYLSSITFTINGVQPDAAVMLDIEELHLRNDSSIAYTVFVNGAEVYNRVYAPSADGFNHAFFDIPAEVCGQNGRLEIRIVNKTDNEVRFRRVWAISDPDEFIKQQGLDKKMNVALMLNQTPTNLNYEYLKQLVDSYKCSSMYNIGLCWEIQYMAWGKEKTEEYLENVITASLYTGAPLYLGINSWWAGTPAGMDGLGGMWQDVTYQQIAYDPLNNNGRGSWQLSTPNEWSDTPWLSMNNEHYTEVRLKRIRETVSYIQKRTAEIASGGQKLPQIHLYTENEPIYWPIYWTQYEKYPRGIGDFSAYVIRDAARDGVVLDPTDGLSPDETYWLYRNLNTYISKVGSAMAEGLGCNYITICDGEVTYPSTQLFMNAYSHSPIQAFYPNWEENRKSWENHVLDSIHFGGEWSVYLDDNLSRGMDYLLAYGSFSNINAERAGFPGGNASKDFRVLSQCYAYGLEGVVIYNVLADTDQNNVINESTKAQTLMRERVFAETPLYESNFADKAAYSLNNMLVAIDNLRLEGNVVVPTERSGGSLTYRLKKASKYSDGLRVCIDAALAKSGRIEILAGSSPEDLKSVGVFGGDSISCAIDPELYADGKDVYVKVNLYNAGLTGAHKAGLAISRVGFLRPALSGAMADGKKYTYEENRRRCLLIASRADAERLMRRYLSSAGDIDTARKNEFFDSACQLYSQCRYCEALECASKALSTLLPVRFTVKGYGALEEYPIFLSVDGRTKVTVNLKEASETKLVFELSANADTSVRLQLKNEGGSWALTQSESGDWIAVKNADGSVKDAYSTYEVNIKVKPSIERPQQFEARLIRATGVSIAFVSQDPAVTDYSNGTELKLAADARIFRGADGCARDELLPCGQLQLQSGDYIIASLNKNGEVEQIYAWYGFMRGKVVSVEEISLEGKMSNPFVTVRADDGREMRFEIGYECALDFSGATGALGKLALVESVGLREGQTVTVTYCPYAFNGRVRALRIAD
ncbi:MAG: hypothetical protein IKR85_05535 [Clostridia bacterium]|nr:hypothetical protein [Clostridia bacterium]